MDKRKISLVLTNYNRLDAITRLINNVTLFDEIVINDDFSDINIFNQLKSFYLTQIIYLRILMLRLYLV